MPNMVQKYQVGQNCACATDRRYLALNHAWTRYSKIVGIRNGKTNTKTTGDLCWQNKSGVMAWAWRR